MVAVVVTVIQLVLLIVHLIAPIDVKQLVMLDAIRLVKMGVLATVLVLAQIDVIMGVKLGVLEIARVTVKETVSNNV